MPLYAEAVDTVRALLDEARASSELEPTAMTLATADAHGRISARVVLLKGLDERGFVFYTNYASAKAAQIEEHHNGALCILWKNLRHIVQVRVEGAIGKISAADSDAYYASRPRESQIGAWASLQSQTLAMREDLDVRVAEFESKFADKPVPRPPHWGGYCLRPDMIEIWYGQRARLHERERYELADGVWSKRLLYP